MVADTGLDLVTGAFSYSGRRITQLLLGDARRVRTLTSRSPDPEMPDIEVRPYTWDDPDALGDAMRGVTTFYNTYWVRFAYGSANHDLAVRNSRRLLDAAVAAGVQRVVHVSIMKPSDDSPYPYFRGKAAVERAVRETGLPHTILRPSVLFGPANVLVNNIAWLLRKMPAFAIAGRGDYRVSPVHVDDLARLAVDGAETATVGGNVLDASCPEQMTFEEMVRKVRAAVGSRSVIVHVPASVVVGLARVLGVVVRDVLLTSEELHTMMDGLAGTEAPPTGRISFDAWLEDSKEGLGRSYANEVQRHFSGS